jgi:ABC-type nitrate/sulfonate/bicarbonate transport system ATPase subunit
VAVLSARPARVGEILRVDIPRPRTVAKVIEHPDFLELRERCWRQLRAKDRVA